MRYLVTMTIDVEKAPTSAPINKPAVAVVPKDPKLTPTPPLTQLVYGIKEVSRILGVGRTSIYYLMKEGKLPYVKLGRRTLIPVRELQVFLDKIQTT